MGNCLGPLWRNGRRSEGGRRERKGSQEIPTALQEFKQRCTRVTTASVPAFSLRDDQLQKLVTSAYELVEGILGGIDRHLGDKLHRVDSHVSAVSPGTPQELLSISVKLEPRVFGEVATRSRVAVSVQVEEELKFILQAPSCSSDPQLLTLRVQGLNLPALPEAGQVRRRLRNDLGSNVLPKEAFRWWKEHRDEECPADSSKFRWVVESLLEQWGMQALGEKTSYQAFWGYLHTTDLHLASFQFLLDRGGGVELRAILNEPKDQQEARDREIVREITMGQLRANRKSAETLASSAINVAAMLFGPEVDQPGAKVEVIKKMLSAAEWWSAGEDGWHRYDKTWNCTDQKDWRGRVVKTQGRIIWHTDSHPTTAPPTGQPQAAGGRSPRAAAAAPRALLDIALFLVSLVIALNLHSRLANLAY